MAMQRCRCLHPTTCGLLSSISPKNRSYNFPFVYASHHQAREIHQDIAPQNSAPRFAYIEDGEPPERYRPGGYHPLSIGDILHHRYHIVHKLGFGSYSTIWLAKDIQQLGRYIAIKIKTAEGDDDSKETQIWRHLWAAANDPQQLTPSPDTTSLGVTYSISPIWDEFTIDGPNGTHRCIGTVPARMTVAEAQDASYTQLFQLKVARVIVAQLIKAVAFMHARGYVHADLHLGNVLLAFPKSIAEMPPDKLFETFGSPRLEPVKIIGNKTGQPLPIGIPSHIVIPAWFGARSEDIKLDEASVILADFGEAFEPFTEKRFHSNTPRTLRPPETTFAAEKPISFAVDIWTLACSIWTILGQRPLVDIFSFTDDYVTREQVDALGRLPEDWWTRWDARSKYFDSQGNLLDHTCPRRSLEVRFEDSIQLPRRKRGMESIGDEEKSALLSMLRAMLAFIPEERPTAASLLDCEWMVKWALPDLREAGIASP
ncbi:kinase-like protein [Nemania serpens]|nr:kinase-like protein [Nemania serpens]